MDPEQIAEIAAGRRRATPHLPGIDGGQRVC
jgi:hypothetical protein